MKSFSPRITLLAVLSLFLLPLILAWLAFRGTIGIESGGTANLGSLVQPTVSVDWSDIQKSPATDSATALGGHWVILYPIPQPCTQSCQDRVTSLRQVHRATGRDRSRVVISLWEETELLPAERNLLLGIYPEFLLIESQTAQLAKAVEQARINSNDRSGNADLFLLDPLGNIMMTYNSQDRPEKLSKDLKRLLKWSKLDNR